MISRAVYGVGAVGAAAIGGTLLWAGARTKADAEQTRLMTGGGYGAFGGGFGGGYGYGNSFNNVTTLADGASGALMAGGALATLGAGIAGMKAFSKTGASLIAKKHQEAAKLALNNANVPHDIK